MSKENKSSYKIISTDGHGAHIKNRQLIAKETDREGEIRAGACRSKPRHYCTLVAERKMG